MKVHKKKRILITFVGLSLLGLLFLGFGCGDGDHDFVPAPPAEGGGAGPELPETLTLRIADPVSVDPLEEAFALDDQNQEQAVVKVTEIFLEVSYNMTTEAVTVEAGGTIAVDASEVPLDECTIGELTIDVAETVRWLGTEFPTEGQFKIIAGDDIITLTVNPDADGAGNPGVDIGFDQGGDGTIDDQVSLTWEELEELMDQDPPAPEYQRIAAFGFEVYEFLFERAELGLELLAFVVEQREDLEAAGGAGVFVACDEFPPGSGSSGSRQYVWDDGSGDGSLGSGDNFGVTYNTSVEGCWVDEPTDDIDTLYGGTINLNDYVEQTSPLQIGGDIVFDEFTETETIEDPPGQFTKEDEPSGTTNGGFNLLIE